MMVAVDFIYFDLDDTLLDHRSAQSQALADLSRFLWGDKADRRVGELTSTYSDRNRELWHAYADGEIDRDHLRAERFEHIVSAYNLKSTTWRELDQFYMDRYRVHWSVIEGARNAYESIADRLPVGVITNGFADVQHAKLRRFPFIASHADAVVISEEEGYLKPDPRLFAIAERKAGVSGDRILYVGDSYRSDVLGAVNAGWQSAWFTDSVSDVLPERTFAFNRWGEFVKRVRQS